MPSATHPTLAAALETLETQCELSADTLRAIAARFRERLVHGLSHDGANMACIPSFVTGVPDGSEKGTYLALDLGGTNLRCCQVKLSGGGQFTMKQEKYKVSDALKTGPAHDLFAYIAKSIGTFLKDYGDQEDCANATREDPLLVGFTFSFPVEQTAIDRGTLIKWTKGFNCPDAPGMEVVSLLQSCIDEAGIPARVNALVNDTVGALLAHGYQQGGALIGGIFGTGTNGAYVESVERIQKMNPEFAHGESTMIINTEWGGFDDERAALPITLFDNVVDRTSIRPRHHAFEKMISGMYLGELVRAVLIHLIDSLHLFDGYSSALMNEQYAFDTAYVSAVLADEAPEGPSSPTRAVILQTMGMDEAHVSEQDLKTVKRVCEIVGRRAGRLSAVAIGAVVQHTGHDQRPRQESIDVGVDGSVYEHLPHFEEWLREGLRDLLGEENEKRVKIDLAKDGSGVGAALCALQAKKQADRAHARRQTM